MADHFAELGKELHALCPPGYQRAWVEAKVGDDWDDQTVWCETKDERIQPEVPAARSFQMGRTLRSIRRDTARDGAAPFSSCTFTLSPDGTFKFDVGYDD